MSNTNEPVPVVVVKKPRLYVKNDVVFPFDDSPESQGLAELRELLSPLFQGKK